MSPPPAFWQLFGRQLAEQHRISQEYFGLAADNYMGALPQSNTAAPDWPGFLIRQRLEPQVRLATDKGYFHTPHLRQFERLYTRLPDLFPPEPPALLHGDLWSGNFLCDEHSHPVLIDPAVLLFAGTRRLECNAPRQNIL